MASIQSVVAKAKMRLRLSNTSTADADITILALESIDRIAPLNAYVLKQTEIDVIDNEAEAPCDMKRLVALRFGPAVSESNSDSISSCQKAIYVDMDYLYQSGCDCSDTAYRSYAGTFRIDNNIIRFNSNVESATCIITYLGKATDCDGFPVVNDDWEMAMVYYCCAEYARMFPVTSLDQGGYLNTQIDGWYEQFKSQRNKVRSKAVAENARLNKAEIMAAMNALSVVKAIGYK